MILFSSQLAQMQKQIASEEVATCEMVVPLLILSVFFSYSQSAQSLRAGFRTLTCDHKQILTSPVVDLRENHLRIDLEYF